MAFSDGKAGLNAPFFFVIFSQVIIAILEFEER